MTTPNSAETAMEQYHEALVNRDLDQLAQIIDSEAVYLFSNEAHMIGRKEVMAGIEGNFNAIRDETYKTSKLRWLVRTQKAAVCVYEYHWTGIINEQQMSGGGRGTNVFRLKDGAWRIVHEHLSKGSLTTGEEP